MKTITKIRFIVLLSSIILLQNCTKAAEGAGALPPAPELPVYTVITSNTSTFQEFPTALEGKNNVEIRSQVDGYLDKIYVEEGAFVRAGQPLFKIDSRSYGEQVNMASANLQAAIAIQENALSILVGENPDKISRTIEMSDSSLPQNISAGIPAAMVSRRPDVRQQELVLLESNSLVGIAQANMYPSLKITANGGVNSFKIDNWFQIPASLFGSVLGGITQPIFQKRQLKTDLNVAKIQREKNVLAFRQSVLNAVGEVSDALVSNENLKLQEVKASEQVTTLKDGIKSAELLYKGGMANYLEVITAQANSLQAELNLASIKRQRLSSIVDLYRALGGGWK